MPSPIAMIPKRHGAGIRRVVRVMTSRHQERRPTRLAAPIPSDEEPIGPDMPAAATQIRRGAIAQHHHNAAHGQRPTWLARRPLGTIATEEFLTFGNCQNPRGQATGVRLTRHLKNDRPDFDRFSSSRRLHRVETDGQTSVARQNLLATRLQHMSEEIVEGQYFIRMGRQLRRRQASSLGKGNPSSMGVLKPRPSPPASTLADSLKLLLRNTAKIDRSLPPRQLWRQQGRAIGAVAEPLATDAPAPPPISQGDEAFGTTELRLHGSESLIDLRFGFASNLPSLDRTPNFVKMLRVCVDLGALAGVPRNKGGRDILSGDDGFVFR
jgi:hypothetical protein